MALEPITRQEQIIAGSDLQPITRMEKFLKQYGGGSGGGGIFDVTVSRTGSSADGYVYTADKTASECISAHKAGKILRLYADWYGGMYGTLNGVSDEADFKSVSFCVIMFGSSLGLTRVEIAQSTDGTYSVVFAEDYKINFDVKPAN